jgi:dTDP-glucose pyrophosphorylase
MQQTMDAIYNVCYNPNIITISETTQGAASSALLLQNYMNGEEELIIANCDQIMNWNSYRVLSDLRKHEGAVVTINDSDPKHSYVKMSGESAVQVTEKQVISNNALTGIHYWKHAKYFFESAKRMISENNKSANGEYYVAPTYNYLIKDGLDIGMCRIKNDEFYPVGTPEDLEKYLYDSR